MSKYQISEKRLLKLLDDFISISFPEFQKIGVNKNGANITSFILPEPEDEHDTLILKYGIKGLESMEQFMIHPRFLEAVESMFNNNIDIEGLIKKWFDNKEVDQMIE
jgi:hypothetical protein